MPSSKDAGIPEIPKELFLCLSRVYGSLRRESECRKALYLSMTKVTLSYLFLLLLDRAKVTRESHPHKTVFSSRAHILKRQNSAVHCRVLCLPCEVGYIPHPLDNAEILLDYFTTWIKTSPSLGWGGSSRISAKFCLAQSIASLLDCSAASFVS